MNITTLAASISILSGLIGIVTFYRKKVQEKQVNRRVRLFFTDREMRRALRYHVESDLQNISPLNEREPSHTEDYAVRDPAIPFFLKLLSNPSSDEDTRFYFILADSGMGKTTFLLNLITRYTSKRNETQPKMMLFPLGNVKSEHELTKIPENDRPDTILLLDAFDEDPKIGNDYRQRLEHWCDLVSHFHTVLVTCRTQFFARASDEPTDVPSSTHGSTREPLRFQKFYLSPFTSVQVNQYLSKRFPLYQLRERRRAAVIVAKASKLMARPMLLAHVEALVAAENVNTSVEIFDAMIQHWAHREATKKGEPHYREKLLDFSSTLALRIWTLRTDRGLCLSGDEMNRLAAEEQIDFQELTNQDISQRSLLNRDSEGNYKFAHKSILEFLLARHAFENAAVADTLRSANYDQVEECLNFLREFLHVSYPLGYRYTGDLNALLQAIPKGQIRMPPAAFLLVSHAQGMSMTCTSECEPASVKIALLAKHRLEIIMVLLKEFPIDEKAAEAWADTVKSADGITVFRPAYVRHPSAVQSFDNLRNAFRRRGIEHTKFASIN